MEKEKIQIVSGEKKEARVFETIERNYKAAEAMVKLEEILSKGKIDEKLLKESVWSQIPKETSELIGRLTGDKNLADELNNLPVKITDRFMGAISWYISRREGTVFLKKKIEEAMRGQAGEEEFIRDLELMFSSEEIGDFIFELKTGDLPVGRIRAYQKEAYFIIILDEVDDFSKFVLSVDRDEDEDSSRSFDGMFYKSVNFNFDEIGYLAEAPFLVIKKLPIGMKMDQLVVHERQHFINSKALDEFNISEPFKKPLNQEKIEEDDDLKAVKDEILAYVRDGCTGLELGGLLMESHYYDKLFFYLSPELKKRVFEIISRVSDFLNGPFGNLKIGKKSKDEIRAILVYQLAQVPLLNFPKWLPKIEAFLEKKAAY